MIYISCKLNTQLTTITRLLIAQFKLCAYAKTKAYRNSQMCYNARPQLEKIVIVHLHTELDMAL